MDILFLEIDTENTWSVCSLGPGFLARIARARGHDVAMIRIPEDRPIDEVVADVLDRAPDLVGLSLTTRQWLRGRDIAGALRAAGGPPLIAGGLHPTFSPEDTLAHPGFDAVCLGEGEVPFAGLLEHLEAGGTLADASLKNIWVRGGSHPGLGAPVEDIDTIPFMARDMLDERYGVVNMTTQRGCPFPCTYCAARMYDQLYDGIGKYGRRRSIESVMRELEQIRDEDQLSYVIFLDDTFTINHPWVLEFCEIFQERIGVGFSIHARAETMRPNVIEALAKAGCKHIVYGVESGSERVRRDIMKRPVSNDRLVDVFERTKATGIMVTCNYMIGVPGERPEDIQATMDLHERLQPFDFGYFVFYPFPGTPLFQTCRQQGLLPDNWQELPARHDASILNLPDLTAEDIKTAFDRWTEIRAETVARSNAALQAQAAARETEQAQAVAC